MNVDDYRRYQLHVELRDHFTLDKAPEDSPDELRLLATAVCNKCPEMWDVHIPLGKGAFNVLQQHYSHRHAPPQEWSGEIRRRKSSSRLERKLDNVLACVSYLPGLGPGGTGGGWRWRWELPLEPRDEGSSSSGPDGGEDGSEETAPVDGGKATA